MRGCVILLSVCIGSPALAGENWPCLSRKALSPSFLELSEVTGGQVLMLEPNEVEKASFAAVQRPFHPETVLRAFGQMDGEVRDYLVPIDSSIESLLISVSVECNGGIQIKTSQKVDASGEGRTLRQSRILKVSKPVPGPWRIRLVGRGRFYVVVEAKTLISLDRAAMVDGVTGRQQEGWFTSKRAPKLGQEELWRLDLSGPATGVRFRLIGGEGQTLSHIDEKPADVNESYIRRITADHERFRIAADGVDERGYPFQRVTKQMVLAARN